MAHAYVYATGIGALVIAFVWLAIRRRRAAGRPHKRGVVELHQFPPSVRATDGLRLSANPICAKTEVFLRFARVPYVVVNVPACRQPYRFPFAVLDGQTIVFSSAIVRAVSARFGVDMDAHLDERQRALGVAVRRMLEQHTYFLVLHSHWTDRDGWTQMCAATGLARIPWPVRVFLLLGMRAGVINVLRAQGVGRMSREERMARMSEDVSALSVVLGDSAYVLGDKMSSVDATVFAFLRELIRDGIECPLSAAVRAHANLVSYVDRLSDEFRSTPHTSEPLADGRKAGQ